MYYRYGRKFVDVILFLRYFNFFNNVKLIFNIGKMCLEYVSLKNSMFLFWRGFICIFSRILFG